MIPIALFACSAANDSPEEAGGITSEELTAGSAYGEDYEDEPADVDEEGTPDDGAAATDEADDAGAGTSPQSLRILSGSGGCARTTGYRRGASFSICVTSIDGKRVERATADAFLRMRAAAARSGVAIKVVSGFRTMDEQRRLYALYKQGRGNKAAPPGFSNHQSGHALDLNSKARGVYAWLSAHGAAYGFRRTVSGEPWHWEHW